MKVIKDGNLNGKQIELRDCQEIGADYEVLEVGVVADTVLYSSSSVVSASNYFDDLFRG